MDKRKSKIFVTIQYYLMLLINMVKENNNA